MPRKPQSPKDLRFGLTSDKTGATVKVGNSPTHCVTLHPRHVTELAKLLGVTLATDGKTAAGWIEAVKTAEAERDTERKTVALLRAEHGRVLKERDASLARAKAAEEALCKSNVTGAEQKRQIETLTKERDAARLDLEQWRIANERNLRDLNEAQTKLVELRKGFDELTKTASQQNADNIFEIERLRADLARSQRLGWMNAGIAFAAGIVGLLLSLRMGWIGGAK